MTQTDRMNGSMEDQTAMRTKFSQAAWRGDTDEWDRLVDTITGEEELLQRDEFGETPIHLAARNGHLEFVRMLVRAYKADPNDVNFEGWTPLTHATVAGHTKLAEYLMKSGANLNVLASGKNTLLHLAAWHGNHAAVEWLLGQGLDPEAVNAYGCKPEDMSPPGRVRADLKAVRLSKAPPRERYQDDKGPDHGDAY